MDKREEIKLRHEERQGWLQQLEERRVSQINYRSKRQAVIDKYENSILLNETKTFLLNKGFDVVGPSREEFLANPYDESLTVAGRIRIVRNFYGRRGYKYELLFAGRYSGRVVVENKEKLTTTIEDMLRNSNRF